MPFTKSMTFVFLAGGCILSGCTPSVQGLADRVRSAGNAEQWHAWGSQVVERWRTNSNPITKREMPEFVQRGTPDGAQAVVGGGMDPLRTPVVIVASFGGFESLGVIVGPPAYVEVGDGSRGLISRQVFPGVYVRESH